MKKLYLLIAGAFCTASAFADCTPPAITSQPPASRNACVGAGGPVAFHVIATGTAPTYQWKKNGVDIAGATTADYIISSVALADNGTYTVVVSNGCGTVTSDPSVLNVNTAPTVSSVGNGGAMCAGASGRTLGVSILSGNNNTCTWQKNGVVMPGATSPTYTILNASASDAGTYLLTVSNSCGNASWTADMEIWGPATVSTQPAPIQNLCVGASATLSASVNYPGGFIQYQWTRNSVDIPGATGLSYTIPSVAAGDAGLYHLNVNYVCGGTVSSAAQLNVSAPVAITTQPVSAVTCAGAAYTFSTTATGGSLGYQWKKNGVAIAGATTSAYSIGSIAAGDAGTYTVQVSNSCSNATSSGATLEVHVPVAITGSTQGSIITCAGGPANFSVTATGEAPIAYQWRKNGVDIPGATSATYTIPATATTDDGTYTARVSNTCTALLTNPANLTVSPLVSITAQPASVAVCPGSAAQFSVGSTGLGVTYTWRKDGVVVPGAFTNTLTIANVSAADAGSYTVNVNAACGNVNSTPATLTVNTATSIIQAPAARTVCDGDPAAFSVLAGGTAPISYQWKKNSTAIAGATASNLAFNAAAATDAASYAVEVTGACGTVATSPVPLVVMTCTAVPDLDPSLDEVLLAPSFIRGVTELRVHARRYARIEWMLVRADGVVAKRFNMQVQPGINRMRLQLDGLAAGSYVLAGYTGKGQTRTIRLVKY